MFWPRSFGGATDGLNHQWPTQKANTNRDSVAYSEDDGNGAAEKNKQYEIIDIKRFYDTNYAYGNKRNRF